MAIIPQVIVLNQLYGPSFTGKADLVIFYFIHNLKVVVLQ